MKQVLTIAGSDSGGGAGIQGDVKTFEAHGVYSATVVTAITAQNTRGVDAIFVLPGRTVLDQLSSVFDDFAFDAIKIGMLAAAEVVDVVASFLSQRARGLPIVLDPVLAASTGRSLADDGVIDLIRETLMPIVSLSTPNVSEARRLLGGALANAGSEEIATELSRQCGQPVLVTGGDSPEDGIVLDVLSVAGVIQRFSSTHLRSDNTHGTGCALSASIAAGLACGYSLVESVSRGRDYVFNAIRRAPRIGSGNGPLLHRGGAVD